MRTKKFNYKRENIQSGILHFGVGNFHRAHLESYTNQLLNLGEHQQWGICGAMIMPQDKNLYHKLKAQEGVYSLTVCGRDGNNEIEWIGSLNELLWSGVDIETIINKVADSNIRIITMTITEGGYSLESEAVKHDLIDREHPQTIFGIIAEGLRRRIAANGGAVTILSCDNLQHNGDTCKKVFTNFFAAQDSKLAQWVEQQVTFPNSMVDRITPATTEDDVERINLSLERYDAAPVYCEDYIQWVVEDNFAAGRPAWEEVGVEFTNDVTPFEKMKLSLLNASHTLLSYPSLLSGYRKVDEAMNDDRVVKFVQDFMDIDVTPYVPAPPNTDLDRYKQILIERFANSAVSDQIARLCGDGASKFPVYVVPIAQKMLAAGDNMVRIAYLVAAYRHYLKYRIDDNEVTFEVFEPMLTQEDIAHIANDNATLFLSIAPFKAIHFADYPTFVELYLKMVKEIKQRGAMAVLETII